MEACAFPSRLDFCIPRLASARLARQRLRRPPLRSGPLGDPPGPLRLCALFGGGRQFVRAELRNAPAPLPRVHLPNWRTPPARRAWRLALGSRQTPPCRSPARAPLARMVRAPPVATRGETCRAPPRPDSMPSRPTGSQPGISHSRSGHGPVHVSPSVAGNGAAGSTPAPGAPQGVPA